jgi:hypothetical protein
VAILGQIIETGPESWPLTFGLSENRFQVQKSNGWRANRHNAAAWAGVEWEDRDVKELSAR